MTEILFDFSGPSAITTWAPINDGVMGGLSHGEIRHEAEGYATFTGHVSLENNGGFASVRCKPDQLGRSGVLAYVLEVRGDGKRYKLNLRTDDAFDGVNYQASFAPPEGIWTTCRLAAADFLPSWRGRPVPGAPPLDMARVRQIGLMITDRQEGRFRLAVHTISTDVGSR